MTISNAYKSVASLQSLADFDAYSQQTLAQKLEEVVSIEDFGGIGDNSTDNANAFSQLTASGKMAWYIPAGTFVTSSTVIVPSGVMLVGAGAASVIKLKAGSNKALMSIAGDSNYVAEIKLDGNGSNQNTNASSNGRVNFGLSLLASSSNAIIRNVIVVNPCDDGMSILGSGHRVVGCSVSSIAAVSVSANPRASYVLGSAISAVTDIMLDGCTAKSNSAGNYSSGIVCLNNSSTRINITNCNVNSVSGSGIDVAASNARIVDNVVATARQFGIVHRGASNVQICNNTVTSAGYSGIAVEALTAGSYVNVKIDDNITQNCGTDTLDSYRSKFGFDIYTNAGVTINNFTFVNNQCSDNVGNETRGMSFDGLANNSIINSIITGNVSSGHSGANVDSYMPSISPAIIIVDPTTCKCNSNIAATSGLIGDMTTSRGEIVKLVMWQGAMNPSTDYVMLTAGSALSGYMMQKGGYLKSFKINAFANSPVTAGSLNYAVMTDGSTNIFAETSVINTSNTIKYRKEFAAGAYTFAQGQSITVKLTTSPGWAPITNGYMVELEVVLY